MPEPALSELIAALELVSSSFAELRAFLPADGYSSDGVVREAVEGFRDAMHGCPGLLREGLLSPAVAADVLACYLLIEGLMAEEQTRTAAAFESHPDWSRARRLAASALAALTARG